MDGHFVPNLTIGPPVVKSLRTRTELFLDCHLMVDNPGVLLDDFADAGADRCIVHVELGDPRPLFDELRARDVGVGLVLNPPTPVDTVLPYLDQIDLLLVMSVQPRLGWPGVHPRGARQGARWRASEIDARGWPVEIEIDGGINVDTAAAAAAAGCDILVAGSAVFAPPIRWRRRVRSSPPPRRGAPGERRPDESGPGASAELVAKVLVVSDGVARGHARGPRRPEGRRAAQRRRVGGARAPR